MPTLPYRSRDYRSYDQDETNQPERIPVNSKRDRGNSNSSSSSLSATMERTRESGRLNEESRSISVGQVHQLNGSARQNDRDEVYTRDSAAGSHVNSRTHSTGLSSTSTSQADGRRLSIILEDSNSPTSVAHPTKPRLSREDPYFSRSKTTTTTNVSKEVEETQITKLSRPALGDLGDLVNLKTNCFKIHLDSSVQLSRYHVHVAPKPNTAREYNRAFELFLKEGSCLDDSRRAGTTGILTTDYRNIVVTVRPLKLGRSNRGQCLVDYYEPEDTGPKKIPSTNTYVFTISLTKAQPMSLNELMSYVASTSTKASFGRMESTIQVLNIAMSQKPWENMLGSLKGGLVAQSFHSARIINAGPSFFANIIPRIGSFYEAGTLVELIRAFRSSGRTLLQLQGFLKGVRVEVPHLKTESGQSRVKTITGLALVPKLGANAYEVTFVWMKEEISVADYFMQKYGRMLEFSSEPVVNVGNTKKPTFLPPELCIVLPSQRANRALSPDQAKEMNKLRLKNANTLVKPIEDQVGHKMQALAINARDKSEPEAFGVSTQANMLRLTGLILPAPQIQYQTMEFTPDFGSWNLKEDRKFKTGAGITKWAYTEVQFPFQGWTRDLLLASTQSTSQVEQFLDTLEKSYQSTICARQNGLKDLVLDCTCPEKQFADLDKYFHQCRKKSIKTLLLLLPDNRQTLFACIKYLGDVKYGIQTICIELSTLHKYINKSWYAGTIAQKLNTKGGGVNQCLPRDELNSLLSTSTMVVGIDVTNPFPKGQALAATSIIGVVASKDGDCTQWPASVRRQDQPDKIVTDLQEMMVERLVCWRETNGSFPANILIYRNGVTEKATAVVLGEIRAIEEAIALFYNALYSPCTLPKITAIAVSRSHRLRFYPDDDGAADGQSGNPKVGTVVDRVVTSNVPWDFYLQSHPGTPESGTVCPAHYVVVKNDMGFTADDVQSLTNKLCYLSARGTRAMSIVPPARYAAAVCARARCFVVACKIDSPYWLDSQRGWFCGDWEGEGWVRGGCGGEQWVRGVHEELADSMWYV